MGSAKLDLFTLGGRLVCRETLQPGRNSLEHPLEAGTYLAKVHSENFLSSIIVAVTK